MNGSMFAPAPLSDSSRAKFSAPRARGFGPPSVSEPPPDRETSALGVVLDSVEFVTWMRWNKVEIVLFVAVSNCPLGAAVEAATSSPAGAPLRASAGRNSEPPGRPSSGPTVTVQVLSPVSGPSCAVAQPPPRRRDHTGPHL